LPSRPADARISMADAPVQIGNYRLGKNLGIGAFGKVKRE